MSDFFKGLEKKAAWQHKAHLTTHPKKNHKGFSVKGVSKLLKRRTWDLPWKKDK